MSRNISRRPLAVRDIEEIADYIALDNHEAAMRFVDAVEAQFETLAEYPHAGRSRPRLRGGQPQLRSMAVHGFRNYLVFYVPVPDGIEVIRVLHGARDLHRLLKE